MRVMFPLYFLFTFLTSTIVHACDIPVFRYALERWASDPYIISIVVDSGLNQEEQGILSWLQQQSVEGGGHSNFTYQVVSASDIPAEAVPETLPGFLLQYPASDGTQGILLSGRFDRTTIGRVLQSPVRETIASRLLEGQSAVWVMVESGDREKDDTTEATLKSILDELETSLTLPTKEDRTEEETVQLNDPNQELRIEFSVLRISKTDPDEMALARMLLQSELDLVLYADEPIVFPVYGQGRAHFAFVGKGINRETIRDGAAFLVGPCSCIIKDDNPGTDLLFTADWSGRLKSELVVDKVVPPPFAVPEEALGDAVYAVTPVTLLEPQTESAGFGQTLIITLLSGFALVSLAGVAFILVRSRQSLR